MDNKFRVTYYSFSKILNKGFRNVEHHRSEVDYKLRASALGWQIEKVETLKGESN
jgi:hypothetical protein